MLVIAVYAASFTGCTNGSSGSGANDDTPPTGPYVQVPFGPNGTTLDAYLKTANPASDGVYYIEVMNLTKEDLKGTDGSFSRPGQLGKILQANNGKKVAVKLGGTIEDLTDMSFCFYECKNLVRVPSIPSGVTNMQRCFYDCINLEEAPELPQSVAEMNYCFYCCTNLTKVFKIPSSVTDIRGCFSKCTNLIKAPDIPSSVRNMDFSFDNCESLINPPKIYSGVTSMSLSFDGCKKPKFPQALRI